MMDHQPTKPTTTTRSTHSKVPSSSSFFPSFGSFFNTKTAMKFLLLSVCVLFSPAFLRMLNLLGRENTRKFFPQNLTATLSTPPGPQRNQVECWTNVTAAASDFFFLILFPLSSSGFTFSTDVHIGGYLGCPEVGGIRKPHPIFVNRRRQRTKSPYMKQKMSSILIFYFHLLSYR